MLNHRVLHVVIDDIDSSGACSRQNESREWIRYRRSAGRESAGRLIEEEDVAGAYLHGKSAPIQSTLERLDFECDAIVENSVASAHAEVPSRWGNVESHTRSEVVLIAFTLALEKRQ